MVRRGVDVTPRRGTEESRPNAFTESLRRNNIRPFQNPEEYHMNTNNTNTAEQIDEAVNSALNAEKVQAKVADLRQQADALEAELKRHQAENDQAETGPSNMASKLQQNNKFKTARKVLGWTRGVGVVAAGGLWAVSKLREMGADVSDDVATAIENAGDTVAEAIAG